MDELDRIEQLVDAELVRIQDRDLVCRVRALLVTPHLVEREWAYGAPNQICVCWTVLEHRASNTGIAYCDTGFGPNFPWGLVFLSGPRMSIGMDSAWYETLEEAVRESCFFDAQKSSGTTVDREV
jgi:hypothetical protein